MTHDWQDRPWAVGTPADKIQGCPRCGARRRLDWRGTVSTISPAFLDVQLAYDIHDEPECQPAPREEREPRGPLPINLERDR